MRLAWIIASGMPVIGRECGDLLHEGACPYGVPRNFRRSNDFISSFLPVNGADGVVNQELNCGKAVAR
jgi:hypothetical protein